MIKVTQTTILHSELVVEFGAEDEPGLLRSIETTAEEVDETEDEPATLRIRRTHADVIPFASVLPRLRFADC